MGNEKKEMNSKKMSLAEITTRMSARQEIMWNLQRNWIERTKSKEGSEKIDYREILLGEYLYTALICIFEGLYVINKLPKKKRIKALKNVHTMIEVMGIFLKDKETTVRNELRRKKKAA